MPWQVIPSPLGPEHEQYALRAYARDVELIPTKRTIPSAMIEIHSLISFILFPLSACREIPEDSISTVNWTLVDARVARASDTRTMSRSVLQRSLFRQ